MLPTQEDAMSQKPQSLRVLSLQLRCGPRCRSWQGKSPPQNAHDTGHIQHGWTSEILRRSRSPTNPPPFSTVTAHPKAGDVLRGESALQTSSPQPSQDSSSQCCCSHQTWLQASGLRAAAAARESPAGLCGPGGARFLSTAAKPITGSQCCFKVQP